MKPAREVAGDIIEKIAGFTGRSSHAKSALVEEKISSNECDVIIRS